MHDKSDQAGQRIKRIVSAHSLGQLSTETSRDKNDVWTVPGGIRDILSKLASLVAWRRLGGECRSPLRRGARPAIPEGRGSTTFHVVSGRLRGGRGLTAAVAPDAGGPPASVRR